MRERKIEDDLWEALETAVRTYREELPVDAFLPPPEARIWREPKGAHFREPERVPEDRRFEPQLAMEPGIPFAEETDLDIFDAPAEDVDIIDEELGNQLEG